MSSTSNEVKYLLFDVESVADGDAIAKTRYPNRGYTAKQAIDAGRIKPPFWRQKPSAAPLPISIEQGG